MKKTIVITGATSGIGLQSAIGLAQKGDRIVVTGRNRQRGEAAVQQIKEVSQNEDIHLVLGDLSVQKGIQELASELQRFEKIDVLINNAGMFANELTHTSDGFEIDFAVNVVAPYTLTRLLLPQLKAAPSARVLNVTGGSPTGKLDIANLQAEKGFTGMGTYNHSKRAMDAMSIALARDLEPQGIYVNVIYPGAASTSMTKGVTFSKLPLLMRPLYPLFQLFMREDNGKGAKKAARSSIWGAHAPETEKKSGQYFNAHCKPTKFHASLHDPQNQQAVLNTIQATMAA